MEDGLSQSTVYAIIQDHQGYLWFGTSFGLDRYDGYNFKVYYHNPYDSASISSDWIRSIIEDSDHNIWIGTMFGLNRFSKATNEFIRYIPDEHDPFSISAKVICCLFEDSKKRIWAGTWRNGLNRYIKNEDHFIHYNHDPSDSTSISDDWVMTVYEDSKQHIWIGTYYGGLNLWNEQDNTFTAFKHDPHNSKSISHNNITSIVEDKEGYIWVGTENGLNKFNLRTKTFIRFYKIDQPGGLPSSEIINLFRANDDNIWILTRQGIVIYDYSESGFKRFKPFNNFADNIFQEKNGALWLTYIGLYRLDPNYNRFMNYNQAILGKGAETWCFMEEEDNIWIGTGKGLFGLRRNNDKTFNIIPKKPGNLLSRIKSRDILANIKDRFGNYWIGTLSDGLVKYSRNGHTIHYYGNKNYPVLNKIKTVTVLRKDKKVLWIGSLEGLYKYYYSSDRFIKVEAPSLDSHSRGNEVIDSALVLDMLKDSRGIIWTGKIADGLFGIYPESNKRIRYFYDRKDTTSLNSNTIHCIYEDDEGFVWLATSQGLNVFKPAEKIEDYRKVIFRHYTVEDGLPNNLVWAILPDDHGNLWLSTNKGICRFNPKLKRFKSYSVIDGLQGDEYNSNAAFKDRDGCMYFGGVNGFNIFHPDSIKDNKSIPPVVITDFRVFEKSFNIYNKNEVDLSYDQNSVSFEFAALDYTAPEKNQYAYRLEGLETNWHYTTKRRFVNYTNLDPGSYRFRVKGSNSDGIWNTAGTSLDIFIAPPYWQTWWFILFILAVLAAIILALHKYRVKQLLEVEKIRVRIAGDLHDDVGSSLTKISMFSDLVNEQTSPAQNKEMLNRISIMSRDLIKTMSDIVWAIDVRKDNLGELIDRMKEIAFSSLQLKNIRIHFDMKNIDPDKEISANVRQNLYLIFKEAINNIVKHSTAKKVDVKIELHGGILNLAISDDGNGLTENVNNNGNGLKNMQARTDRINGTFELKNGNGLMLTVKNVKI